MWPLPLMIGMAAAAGSLAVAQGAMRAGLTAGLAVNRAMRREALRAMAEAAEVVEDRLAEARELGAPPPLAGPGHPVIEGRAAAAPGEARPPAPPAPVLLVASAGQRRLRLRVLGARGPGQMRALADALAGFPGVRRALAREITGSLVLEAEGTAEALAASLESAGVARLGRLAFRHPAALAAEIGLARLDAAIRIRSAGAHDLASLLSRLVEAEAAARRRPRGG